MADDEVPADVRAAMAALKDDEDDVDAKRAGGGGAAPTSAAAAAAADVPGQAKLEAETAERRATGLAALRAAIAKHEAAAAAAATTTATTTTHGAVVARKADDAFLLLFLRVAKWDVDKALGKVVGYQKVYDEHVAPQLAAGERFTALRFESFLLSGIVLPLVGDVRDRAGRRVWTSHYAKLDYERHPPAEMTLAMLYLIERALRDDGEVLSTHGLSFVADCKGIGWAHFNIEMEKLFMGVLQDAMPVRIGLMALAREPAIMSIMWRLLRPFMNKKLRERVRFCGAKPDAALAEWFGADALPLALGGSVVQDDAARAFVRHCRRAESDEVVLHAPRAAGDARLGLVVDPNDDFRINGVRDGGLGERLGARVDDFIVEFNGRAVAELAHPAMPPPSTLGDGDTVELRVRRTVRDVFGNALAYGSAAAEASATGAGAS